MSRVRALARRKFRRQYHQLVIEGRRVVEDALMSHADVEFCIVDSDRRDNFEGIISTCLERSIPVYCAPGVEFERICDTEHSQGVIAIGRYTETTVEAKDFGPGSPAVIPFLLGIADPGNLGSILRTADWFGDSTVVLSHGSVDPSNPKAVRASAGALFRIHVPICYDTPGLIAMAVEHGYDPVVTVPSGGEAIHRLERDRKRLVIFGSEGHGINEALDGMPLKRITIPSASGAESLNLALSCAIILYELQRPAK
jgi:TrmH family RNA methyltransferase